MTDFTPHTLETADEQGRDVLEQVQKNYGFVPNLLGNMAHAPATAKGYLALGKLVGETSFDATQQQVILLTVSRYNECEYCIGAHSAISAMQKSLVRLEGVMAKVDERVGPLLANLTEAFPYLKLYKIGDGDVGIVASPAPLALGAERFGGRLATSFRVLGDD